MTSNSRHSHIWGAEGDGASGEEVGGRGMYKDEDGGLILHADAASLAGDLCQAVCCAACSQWATSVAGKATVVNW